MSDFFRFIDMNGYGFFIWTAYAVWLFLLVVLILKVILRKRLIEKKLKYFNLENNGFNK